MARLAKSPERMNADEIKAALNAIDWKDLHAVLRDVQSRFTYVPDIERWKTMDYWVGSESPGIDLDGQVAGDCDDHALMCRHKLNKMGIPNRLVYCLVTEGEERSGHLICEVRGWILDNRFPILKIKQELKNYTWVSISGYRTGEPWRDIIN